LSKTLGKHSFGMYFVCFLAKAWQPKSDKNLLIFVTLHRSRNQIIKNKQCHII